MARFLLLIAIVFTVFLGAAVMPSASAAATPTFFEGTIVEDTAGDYPHTWADIVAVYVSEKFAFDPEERVMKGNYLLFRIELAAPDAPQPCTASAQYDVHFTVDGAEQVVSGVVGTDSPGSQ